MGQCFSDNSGLRHSREIGRSFDQSQQSSARNLSLIGMGVNPSNWSEGSSSGQEKLKIETCIDVQRREITRLKEKHKQNQELSGQWSDILFTQGQDLEDTLQRHLKALHPYTSHSEAKRKNG